jgi:hypothetical protein
MKHRLIIIATLATLGVAGLAMAQDADGDATRSQDTSATPLGPWGPAFVDEDGDGVCDRFQDGTWQGRMGRGGGWGRGLGPGPAFVDEDGDGVCDRFQQGAGMGRRGRGNGWRGGRGRR